MTNDRRIPPNLQVPTFGINEAEVVQAYKAFTAMQRIARDNPELRDNPYFSALKDSAFARFISRFEAM